MLWEEYRFLRYYIPGSLFLVYLGLLLLPNSILLETELIRRWDVLLSTFIGAFVISPPIGYVVYTFYDSILYERIATCKKWRTIFRLLEERDEEHKLDTNDKKKEFIDLLFQTTSKDPIRIDQRVLETIRGIWSHFNARIVCSTFVPFFSILCFFLLYVIRGELPFEIFRLRSLILFISILIIVAISLILIVGARRPYRETCRLEEYLFRAKKREIKRLLEILPKSEENEEKDKEEVTVC